MIGRMCLFLGLLLLGPMCFPACADAAANNANTDVILSIQEAAVSAESAVVAESSRLYVSPPAINEAARHQEADEQAKLTAVRLDENMLAGIFRRRSGEARTPLRSIFRGGGAVFRAALSRGSCG